MFSRQVHSLGRDFPRTRQLEGEAQDGENLQDCYDQVRDPHLHRWLMINVMVMLGRHGESEWNQQNRFCGWFDANLSETGIKVIDHHDDDVGDDGEVQEAHAGGKALKDAGYKFDVAHTSVLQVTLLMVLMVSFTVTLKLFVKNRLKS